MTDRHGLTRVRRRYAMPILQAQRLGTDWAAAGATRGAVVRWLGESGYRQGGITARRVLRAYDEQVARG